MSAPTPAASHGPVGRIDRLSFTAQDLERTGTFYHRLGFATGPTRRLDVGELALLGLAGSRGDGLSMRLGQQSIEFLRFDPPGRPYPLPSTATDLWFQHIAIAVSDMDEACRRVMAAGAIAISQDGPQVLPPNTGGVAAFKFRDLEGRPLELLHFPPGVGAPAWSERRGLSPFLGIDHTAVSVADAGASRAFYESLGLRAQEGSRNSGPAQDRLDDVARDRVRVVPMRPPSAPPHVELLAYAVGSRRPLPADTRADDVWATRIVFETRTEPRGASLIRDPDGHALVLAGASASLDRAARDPL